MEQRERSESTALRGVNFYAAKEDYVGNSIRFTDKYDASTQVGLPLVEVFQGIK